MRHRREGGNLVRLSPERPSQAHHTRSSLQTQERDAGSSRRCWWSPVTLRERIQLERQASGEALEVIVEGNDGHLVPRRIRTHQEVSIRALHALATTCTEGLGRAFATRRLQWKIGDSAEMVLKST